MTIFSYYIPDVMDKAWFDSSNVVYAECDESDTPLKTVRVVFKNGTQYQYKDVNVNDWVKFKALDSQGKALNEIFKKGGYEYEKLDNVDLEALSDELDFRSNHGVTINKHNMDSFSRIKVFDYQDKLIDLVDIRKDEIDRVSRFCQKIITELGCKVRLKDED